MEENLLMNNMDMDLKPILDLLNANITPSEKKLQDVRYKFFLFAVRKVKKVPFFSLKKLLTEFVFAEGKLYAERDFYTQLLKHSLQGLIKIWIQRKAILKFSNRSYQVIKPNLIYEKDILTSHKIPMEIQLQRFQNSQ